MRPILTGSICLEARRSLPNSIGMTDDDIRELEGPPIAVAETHSIFRLTSKTGGPYVAIVAAESREQARRFAAESDSFGAEWKIPKSMTVSTPSMSNTTSSVMWSFNPLAGSPVRRPL